MLLAFSCAVLPVQAADEGWKLVGTDLERARLTVSTGGFFSSELLLFRTSLRAYQVEVIRALEYGNARSAVHELCKKGRAALCINANFFDETGAALGLIVHRGITVQGIHRGGKTLNGIFSASRNEVKISARNTYTPERTLEAIQAGPRILLSRRPVPGVEQSSRSRRSGICIDSKQRLVVFIVSSGFWGMSMEELQKILLRPEIGCIDALNLDGGGSSQLYVSKDIPGATAAMEEVDLKGRDPVPVALALVPTR
jgi:uncharacterized protein YigE (DUF2233 family)